MRRLEIINGPNNNFYGIRNKELTEYGATLDFEVHAFQSNCEGALIDHLQELYYEAEKAGQKIPVIMNPGAFTHYSYALMDAIESVHELVPVVECHMSNIHKRDEFRHKSVTACENTTCLSKQVSCKYNNPFGI